MIALRLREYLGSIVSPNQASFVPGKHIHDNIIIAQELIHSMDKLKRSRKFMLVKVDLEKAYDRIAWDFLDETLELVGIPRKLINIILDCVSSAKMQILWNGQPTFVSRMRRGAW